MKYSLTIQVCLISTLIFKAHQIWKFLEDDQMYLKYSPQYLKSVQLCFGLRLIPCLQKEDKTQCCVLTLTNTITQERYAQNIQH